MPTPLSQRTCLIISYFLSIEKGLYYFTLHSNQVFADAPAALAPVPDVEPLSAAVSRLPMENARLKKRCPDEHDPATHPGPRPRPGRWFGGRSLSGPGLGPQQLL